jgi:rubredoxin
MKNNELSAGASSKNFKKWMCLICGWVYDEETGAPEDGIMPGTSWDNVPINWSCPECGARKYDFEMVEI